MINFFKKLFNIKDKDQLKEDESKNNELIYEDDISTDISTNINTNTDSYTDSEIENDEHNYLKYNFSNNQMTIYNDLVEYEDSNELEDSYSSDNSTNYNNIEDDEVEYDEIEDIEDIEDNNVKYVSNINIKHYDDIRDVWTIEEKLKDIAENNIKANVQEKIMLCNAYKYALKNNGYSDDYINSKIRFEHTRQCLSFDEDEQYYVLNKNENNVFVDGVLTNKRRKIFIGS